MVRLLLAIVLIVGSSVLLFPADADATSIIEQVDPIADEMAFEAVEAADFPPPAPTRIPRLATAPRGTACRTEIFRPPRW